MASGMALAAACAVLAAAPAAWGAGTHVSQVEFVQYLDQNTALEEVRGGGLDIYYASIPAERLEGAEARRGLQVFESTGGSYSVLLNPAESEALNPFADRQVRQAVNYLLDRNLIVNEVMGGAGLPLFSPYGPYDPEYLGLLGSEGDARYAYNPSLARAKISEYMSGAGAQMRGGTWSYQGDPVQVRVFIRSDDPVRGSIGELLSSELEQAGFSVVRDYGDLNKAYSVVYGSDPADLSWHAYTEGWAGTGGFVRYDTARLGQMYAPWFSSMPGFNNPSFWNYENATIDGLTQDIFSGKFGSESERTDLVRRAAAAGTSEAVRIFLAAKLDSYVANEGVGGIINDFGAGVPVRLTPINARTADSTLAIGMAQIYQGAWNPVGGLADYYSRAVWSIVSDPYMFPHPHTAEAIPVRGSWQVRTAGPHGQLEVPHDAVLWDSSLQEWAPVGPGAESASAVTLRYDFGSWHHGPAVDMADVMHSAYFVQEWGAQGGPDDIRSDPEFTPRYAQIAESIAGIRQVNQTAIEVYVDYWHFDESEIASRAAIWPSMPWEVYAAMEAAVLAGEASFSKSGSASSGVPWLSLVIARDAQAVLEHIDGLAQQNAAPPAIPGMQPEYYSGRYSAASSWIGSHGHAVIGNGPFYLEGYLPESRTIRAAAFEDYLLPAGMWSAYEEVSLPQILSADLPSLVVIGEPAPIAAITQNADSLHYFVSGAGSSAAVSGTADASGGRAAASVPAEQTAMLAPGAGTIRMLAVSEDALRPYLYEAAFIAAHAQPGLQLEPGRAEAALASGPQGAAPYAAAAAAAAALIFFAARRYRAASS